MELKESEEIAEAGRQAARTGDLKLAKATYLREADFLRVNAYGICTPLFS